MTARLRLLCDASACSRYMNSYFHCHGSWSYDKISYFSQFVVYNWGDFLSNFIVGLTNEFSPTNPPKRGSYVLCGQYPGDAAGLDNLTVRCDTEAPMARYVIIQQPEDGIGNMMICEMEVYELNDNGRHASLCLLRHSMIGESSPPLFFILVKMWIESYSK